MDPTYQKICEHQYMFVSHYWENSLSLAHGREHDSANFLKLLIVQSCGGGRISQTYHNFAPPSRNRGKCRLSTLKWTDTDSISRFDSVTPHSCVRRIWTLKINLIAVRNEYDLFFTGWGSDIVFSCCYDGTNSCRTFCGIEAITCTISSNIPFSLCTQIVLILIKKDQA